MALVARRPYGPTAWLVEAGEIDDQPSPTARLVAGAEGAARATTRSFDATSLAALLRAAAPDGVEVVPAARTVLVRCDRRAHGEIGEWIDRVVASAPAARLVSDTLVSAAAVVELPVVYDGDDLDEVAVAAGLTVADVVARHQQPRYRVAFCGFAPGFAYLVGLDPGLYLPRRATPRQRVPAGSVAIAAEYSAVYPTSSPGGWHLLGRLHRDAPSVWDLDRGAPALLGPGTLVRFVAR